jgi:hypothetical protein
MKHYLLHTLIAVSIFTVSGITRASGRNAVPGMPPATVIVSDSQQVIESSNKGEQRQPRYLSFVNAGVLLGSDGAGKSQIAPSVKITEVLQLKYWAYAGVGVGFGTFRDRLSYSSYSQSTTVTRSTVFVDLRGCMSEKSLNPYLAVDAGVASGGNLLSFETGISIPLRSTSSFLIEIGYTYESSGETHFTYHLSQAAYSFLSTTIGISF